MFHYASNQSINILKVLEDTNLIKTDKCLFIKHSQNLKRKSQVSKLTNNVNNHSIG